MTRLASLINAIESDNSGHFGSLDLTFHPSPGNEEVVLVNVEGREELPMFVTQSDEQILCICYLWNEDEVRADKRLEMLEAMLDLNVPMPLSSFARLQDQYVLYGALSTGSRAEELALELITLSDNAVDAIETMTSYLK